MTASVVRDDRLAADHDPRAGPSGRHAARVTPRATGGPGTAPKQPPPRARPMQPSPPIPRRPRRGPEDRDRRGYQPRLDPAGEQQPSEGRCHRTPSSPGSAAGQARSADWAGLPPRGGPVIVPPARRHGSLCSPPSGLRPIRPPVTGLIRRAHERTFRSVRFPAEPVPRRGMPHVLAPLRAGCPGRDGAALPAAALKRPLFLVSPPQMPYRTELRSAYRDIRAAPGRTRRLPSPWPHGPLAQAAALRLLQRRAARQALARGFVLPVIMLPTCVC